MISVDEKAKLVDCTGIYDRNFFKEYYDIHEHSDILYLGENDFITYKMVKDGIGPKDIRVICDPSMFYVGNNLIIDYGYAIAVSKEGYLKTILSAEGCTFAFVHGYADNPNLWFLNNYDCLLLNGCNEHSVALVSNALPLWTGKRLVLIGADWNLIIDDLPDLPGVECFQADVVNDDNLWSYIGNMKYLIVVNGLPHNEKLDRYKQGIMFLDEVMSFTYMFHDYRHLGEDNPDKKFCVIDCDVSNLGLFALYGKNSRTAQFIKAMGMIPVINITRSNKSFYSDYEGDEIWNKFFCQPEGYTYEDIRTSANVYVTPEFYTGTVQEYIMGEFDKDCPLSWPDGKYNDTVKAVIEDKQKVFLPYPEQTIGVLARGTDYITTHYANHPIQASIDMICDKVDEFMNDHPDIKYVYVSTEDASYIEYMKNRYGDKLYYTDQTRYTTKPGESLMQMHARMNENKNGFELGMDYILSIVLLAKCNSLIASGGCGGLGEARSENQGRYKSEYVFDLGVY